MAHKALSQHSKYLAAMVLGGVGDALGYCSGRWEFTFEGAQIHKEVEELGVEKPAFCVSDDTVMHMATAKALVTKSSKDRENEFDNLAHEYIRCMQDMSGRAPGGTTVAACNNLDIRRNDAPQEKLFRSPFNKRAGGCGGAMRAMCIGLRYPGDSELDDLIAVSIESGRVTHHHPVGYLGALVSALFTSYALQGKPIKSWGAELVDTVLPKAKVYITSTGVEVEDNLKHWSDFEDKWRDYLTGRQITDGSSDPVYPEKFGVEERDEFYKSLSYSGWGGASGHDSTIIAYDAFLGCRKVGMSYAAGTKFGNLLDRGVLSKVAKSM
ncbi:ADPRH [Bugula neritina]|uniref:ADP-ribosylhydrolase ARH1 n=1 Tax=Bugula neritina TaxID=10212 RepID=A0A7J7J0I7_BUGNE|nr:ADPRH [Bugula neritina]